MGRWLHAREVAEMLSMSYHGALRIMKRAGAKKIGGLVRVSEEALESYVNLCPDADPARECTSDPAERSGTRRSATPKSTSHLAPKRKPRRGSSSRNCSSVAEFANWRPTKWRSPGSGK